LKQEQLRAKKKDKKHHTQEITSTTKKPDSTDSRKHLQGMRVTQKNLVYVIGLTLKLINDDALALLRGTEYFGQYGKIQKIMINKRKDIPPLRGGTFDKSGSSVSVYVTFLRKEDASKCIAALDSAVVDGNTLRAAYGTTKYCTAFLQHRQCQNPNCMYLHSEQDQDDTESHTREEVATIQHAVKLGQHSHNSSKSTPGSATAKPLLEDKPERPILPTSVSWAKAAGARAHSPSLERSQDQRRQSILSSAPSQPSPVSTPTPPPAVSPATEKVNPELAVPSSLALCLAASEQQSRTTERIFEQVLHNLIKIPFKFEFSPELKATEEFKVASQVSPFFKLKTDGTMENEDDGKSDSKTDSSYSPKPRSFDPFGSVVENGASGKRAHSRFIQDPIARVLSQLGSAADQTQLTRTFSPPRTAEILPSSTPQQYAHTIPNAGQYKTATPPPPGMYFSHAQQYDLQRRQQLMEQQQRLQTYPPSNPEYGYYPQVPASRNYGGSYEDAEHGGVYAPQARRHVLDGQGVSVRGRRAKVDSMQELGGSLLNMRMSPRLQQAYNGQQGPPVPAPPQPQSYSAPQGGVVGRRYNGFNLGNI
jgi:hypothetical protein